MSVEEWVGGELACMKVKELDGMKEHFPFECRCYSIQRPRMKYMRRGYLDYRYTRLSYRV